MGEVLQGGEEKEGYRSIQSRRTADLIIAHNHIYRRCPQNLSVQSTGGAPGTRGRSKPRHGVSAAAHLMSLFPALFARNPLLGGRSCCGGHTATKAFGIFAVWPPKPVSSAVLSSPPQCSGTRDSHTSNSAPMSCHHWQFCKDTEGLL